MSCLCYALYRGGKNKKIVWNKKAGHISMILSPRTLTETHRDRNGMQGNNSALFRAEMNEKDTWTKNSSLTHIFFKPLYKPSLD